MKNIIRAIAFCGIFATAFSATAQNTNSGYFVENYTYRYQLNPAYDNERNFVSMPALGNINFGLDGSLNLNEVLYYRNGKTVLFSSPLVSADEVMKHIGTKNTINANIRETILAGGFKAFGGYNTVSIGARADIGVKVPGELFNLVKNGITNDNYDIHHVGLSALGYAELAFNHSRDLGKILPGLRVGAAVKFLIGMASVDARFNRADLSLGTDEWTVTSDADVYVNLGKFQYDKKYNDKSNREYVSGFNMDGNGSVSPNGFGLAFDLGATYKWQDFTFSLAALDLGFVSFSGTKYATTGGPQTFNTDDHIFNPSDLDSSWDDFLGDFDKLYQLEDRGEIGSHTRGLGATLNIGVEYTFPLYKKLTFGFLNSTRINSSYSWSEARFSANVAPVKCFSAGINFAAGTYGCAFGWLLNYSYTGFNIFVGMDNTYCKLAKQGVPLRSNTAFNFGINFPF